MSCVALHLTEEGPRLGAAGGVAWDTVWITGVEVEDGVDVGLRVGVGDGSRVATGGRATAPRWV